MHGKGWKIPPKMKARAISSSSLSEFWINLSSVKIVDLKKDTTRWVAPSPIRLPIQQGSRAQFLPPTFCFPQLNLGNTHCLARSSPEDRFFLWLLWSFPSREQKKTQKNALTRLPQQLALTVMVFGFSSLRCGCWWMGEHQIEGEVHLARTWPNEVFLLALFMLAVYARAHTFHTYLHVGGSVEEAHCILCFDWGEERK